MASGHTAGSEEPADFDLCTVACWRRLQQPLRRGEVVDFFPYRRLRST